MEKFYFKVGSINDLREMIRDVNSELITESKHQRISKSSNLLTRKQAAKMLGISLPTLAKYIRQGIVPAKRINGRYRLDGSQVMASLNQVNNFKFNRNA